MLFKIVSIELQLKSNFVAKAVIYLLELMFGSISRSLLSKIWLLVFTAIQ
jgi:hypothetical protein